MNDRDMTLDQIATTEMTDRSSTSLHDYFNTYDEVFGHLRDKPINLAELGILGGAGIRTWARWLAHPEARITGVDIELFHYQGCDDPRVSIVVGSQADSVVTGKLAETAWDVVIDDAGHFADAQILCFKSMWPAVKPGGYYVIEDLVSFRCSQLSHDANIMEFLHGISEELQPEWSATAFARRVASDKWDIDWMLIRKGLVIFRKLRHANP